MREITQELLVRNFMSQDRPNATAAPSRLTIGILILTAVLTTAAVLFVAYGWTKFRVVFSTFPETDCWTSASRSICFFDNNMTSDGMIAVLSSFYTNLIVILIGILTLIGIIAALSLRYSAKQHVEAELPMLTKDFFAKNSGRTLLLAQIAELSKDMKDEVASLSVKSGEHSEFIAGFSERLELLEFLIEDTDTGQKVTAPEE